MSIFKRGNVYWFHFVFEGRHNQQSTKQGSRTVARQIEAAVRSDLAKGKVGIKKQQPVPTLEDFKPRVLEEVRKLHEADHPRTIEVYEQTFKRVLSFRPLAKANLRDIDEELIARFSSSQIGKVKPATINRALSVIRRAMYLAEEWRLIDRAPKVRMQKGERRREFVLTGVQRDEFLGGLPEPCKTVARFLLDTGLRVGECCALTWDRVFLEADAGYVFVARGKTESARRYIGLTADARSILEHQKTVSRSQYVFVRFGDRVRKSLWYTAPLSRHTLSEQFTKRKREMGLPWDAVLHSTRHTALTDFGAAGADAFTIHEDRWTCLCAYLAEIYPPFAGDDSARRYRDWSSTGGRRQAQRPILSVVSKLGQAATVSATVKVAQATAVGK